MKRFLALLICGAIMLCLLTGCGEKRRISGMLDDYQRSCREADLDAMAQCFNPSIIKPLTGLLGLFGVEFEDLTSVLEGIVSFVDDYSEEDVSEIFTTLSVDPKSYKFNREKDECNVSAVLSYTVDGEKMSRDYVFHCKEVDGRWYIFRIE